MDVRSRSVDVGLQFSLDLVVREEGLVAGVSDCQGIPVLEQCGPGLEQPGGEGRRGRLSPKKTLVSKVTFKPL